MSPASAAPTGGGRVAQLARFVLDHPANASCRGRALGRTVLWQAFKRLTGRSYDWRHPRGYRLRVPPDSPPASLALYTGGYPDWDEMRLLERVLRPGDTFVDIGANVGVWTLLAASLVGPTGHVDAFEPGPTARSRLLANLDINSFRARVEVHAEALSDSAGHVDFVSDQDAQNRIRSDSDSSNSCIRVPTVRFDEVLAGRHPFAAKIDVEGAERLVLEGARRALTEARPALWVLEVNSSLRRYQASESDLEELFAQHGYDLGCYDEQTRELRLGGDAWRAAQNAVAVARSAQVEIVDRAPELKLTASTARHAA